MSKRHWIPPAAFLFAQLSHGVSWGIIFFAAWTAHFGDARFNFAWIHTVALGWITMAALGVLLHAIPNFVDVEWRGDTLARASLPFYAAGVALMVYAFLQNAALLPLGASLIFAALAVYLGTAFVSLAGAMRGERVQRAVARAFAITFALLLVTALFGLLIAYMLADKLAWPFVAALPPIHANLGMLGWLSLLIFGVSMRTFKPITGNRTRFPFVHIAVGSLALLGIVLLSVGVVWIGGALFSIACVLYVADAFDILLRSTNRHRVPQALIASSLLWLLASLYVGAECIAGKPWQMLYGFLLLMGWAGQMVNAHLHHIGIRLIATVFRGDDDETEPQELLDPRFSWFTVVDFQIAVALVAVALFSGSGSLAARGALFGVIGWFAMGANSAIAAFRARYSAE